jgi:hypothetical protein
MTRSLQHRQHLPGVLIIRCSGGLKFCLGGASVEDLKRWSAVGLFCNFEIPIHRCTSDPGSTGPYGHPKQIL